MDYKAWAEEAKEVDVNAENSFEEVPVGEYECAVKKMELKKSKGGDDMISIWWEILDGDYKGQLLFQNVFMGGDFGKVNYKKFMQSIKTGVNVFDFTSRKELEEVIEEVFEDVTSQYEYLVKTFLNKKEFKEFEIIDVYNI